MKVGYARVSTDDQKLDLQLDALNKAGCEIIYKEQGVSGSKKSRPELNKMLSSLKEGDTVVVWRLDRLGRSLSHLIQMMEEFKTKKISFVSVTENIDTTSAVGNLIFQIFGAFAEFERRTISERVRAGMIAAMSRGKKMGRKPKYTSENLHEASDRTRYRYQANTRVQQVDAHTPEV